MAVTQIEESPAKRAASLAQKRVHECIDKGESFLLDAGAGAGKTYSLIEALRHVIAARGTTLASRRQKIACITYTNVATDEIRSRIDFHPVVCCSTIHAFCWSVLKQFQPFLRGHLRDLNPKWQELLAEHNEDLGQQVVTYDEFGHRHIDAISASIHHDDVLSLFCLGLGNAKLRRLIFATYPILFIDEYQDTNLDLVQAVQRYALSPESSVLVGLFGDDWQQIYEGTCGRVATDRLVRIKKGSNFRSSVRVVSFLNALRPDLPQEVADVSNEGAVTVFHTNGWSAERLTKAPWTGDLPDHDGNRALTLTMNRLESRGWNFSDRQSRVLMLTHKRIAGQQSYMSLAASFQYSDAYIKKNDPHIKFFLDCVEPACDAFRSKNYSAMLAALGGKKPSIRRAVDKQLLAYEIIQIDRLRENGTIGEMIDCLKSATFFRVPDAVKKRESELERSLRGDDSVRDMGYLGRLKQVQYREVSALAQFVNEQTPFSTQHGVKGAEFPDVLVVCGRGWNLYNFGQFLEWIEGDVTEKDRKAYERNRNLFYVACSRPINRLAVLFTQQLSGKAMTQLSRLCAPTVVEALTEF